MHCDHPHQSLKQLCHNACLLSTFTPKMLPESKHICADTHTQTHSHTDTHTHRHTHTQTHTHTLRGLGKGKSPFKQEETLSRTPAQRGDPSARGWADRELER